MHFKISQAMLTVVLPECRNIVELVGAHHERVRDVSSDKQVLGKMGVPHRVSAKKEWIINPFTTPSI